MRSIPVQQAAQAIRGEYLELPGLSLTCEQVQRLYALDGVTCQAVLAALMDVDFLARTADGRYVRRDGALYRRAARRAPRRRAA